MDEQVVVRIQKPVPAAVINDRLEALVKAAREAGDDLEAKEALAKAASEVAEEAKETIEVTLCTASRRQATRRGDMRRAARQWLMVRVGAKTPDEIDWQGMDDETADLWMPMWQAADIMGAVVPGSCVNWVPPTDLEGWADVKDYIFSRLLSETWALNPHWRDEALQLSGNA